MTLEERRRKGLEEYPEQLTYDFGMPEDWNEEPRQAYIRGLEEGNRVATNILKNRAEILEMAQKEFPDSPEERAAFVVGAEKVLETLIDKL